MAEEPAQILSLPTRRARPRRRRPNCHRGEPHRSSGPQHHSPTIRRSLGLCFKYELFHVRRPPLHLVLFGSRTSHSGIRGPAECGILCYESSPLSKKSAESEGAAMDVTDEPRIKCRDSSTDASSHLLSCRESALKRRSAVARKPVASMNIYAIETEHRG